MLNEEEQDVAIMVSNKVSDLLVRFLIMLGPSDRSFHLLYSALHIGHEL